MKIIKTVIAMKRSFLFLLLGTYALFLTGCYTPDDDDDFESQTITPVLIAKGENCFAESLAGTNMVIKTDEAWNALLDTMSSVTDGFTEIEIDFSQYMVLALFEEVKGVGGWSIDITGVTEHANKIVVAYTNLETGNATEVISQPYHIVRIPKSDKEVVFERTGGDGEYPIEISFEGYSLPEGCGWDNLVSDSLYLINSREELPVFCRTNVVMDVDLDKYSLVVLQPSYCNIDSRVDKLLLQQVSAGKYLFTANITPSVTANATLLVISVLVPKIAETAVVELNVNVYHNNDNNLTGTWVFETETKVTVTLKFYPTGVNEGKFYSTVVNDNRFILFADDVWADYKIETDTMYIRYPESQWDREWLIRQHTENVLELKYTGVLPAIPIVVYYLFKKVQN